MGLKRPKIQPYLKELRDKNLINWKRRGLGKTNTYYINPRLENADDKADVTYREHQDVTSKEHQDVTCREHKEYESKNTKNEEDEATTYSAAAFENSLPLEEKKALELEQRLRGAGVDAAAIERLKAYPQDRVERNLTYALERRPNNLSAFLLRACDGDWAAGRASSNGAVKKRRLKELRSAERLLVGWQKDGSITEEDKAHLQEIHEELAKMGETPTGLEDAAPHDQANEYVDPRVTAVMGRLLGRDQEATPRYLCKHGVEIPERQRDQPWRICKRCLAALNLYKGCPIAQLVSSEWG